MRFLFWMSLFIVLYVYLLYPALVGAWAAWRRAHGRTAEPTLFYLPPVSIVVAARNEAARLPDRLANLLAIDYPSRLMEIIVVSDGSTDATAHAVGVFGDRVRSIEIPASGKAAALNAGCAAATHDILVFADARQRFEREALRWLVARFADPAVGGVTGELVLDCEPSRRVHSDRRAAAREDDSPRRRPLVRRADEADGPSSVGDGVGAYWRYEKWLRQQESDVWSVLGATGCIYALRRVLWQPLPAGAVLDDVLAPMRAVLNGFRVVFEPRARAHDLTAPDAAAESRRKVRTLAGNYQILALEPRLVVPARNPVWIQYVSHKIGRLVVPYALAVLLLTSIALATTHVMYGAALAGQIALYGLAMYGAMLGPMRSLTARAARVAHSFVVMNVAAVKGLAAYLGKREVWR